MARGSSSRSSGPTTAGSASPSATRRAAPTGPSTVCRPAPGTSSRTGQPDRQKARRALDTDPHGSAFISILVPDPHSIGGSGSRRENLSKKEKKCKEIVSNCNFIFFKLIKFVLAPWLLLLCNLF